MKSFKAFGQDIPLRLPDVCDRMALLHAYMENQKKPAVLQRLRMAAVGLSWPESTAPRWKSLDECGYDLSAYGNGIAKAFAGEPEPIAFYAAAEMVLAEIFASVAPSTEAIEEAANLSQAGPA